jgi:hypothetical protein
VSAGTHIDPQALRNAWNNPDLTHTEIARGFGLTTGHLLQPCAAVRVSPGLRSTGLSLCRQSDAGRGRYFLLLRWSIPQQFKRASRS